MTTGKSADSLNIAPLLEDAKERFDWSSPDVVSADKDYDALHVYETINEDHGALPVIPMRALRPGAKKRRPNSDVRTATDREPIEWKALYRRRTSVERLFGRSKENRRLERHCYRGLAKVTAQCLMSLAVMQAMALVQVEIGGSLRECLRAAARADIIPLCW